MVGKAVADTRWIELLEGDRLLLCTDGLTAMVDDSAIGPLLNTHSNPEASCRALVDAANEAGGEDNITVLLVEVGK
jgi:protein phosphatase